jgi:pyruvate/2-oxoglutarate dehydrogenase complex dihydrolipoamide acyltransferase (E2) component
MLTMDQDQFLAFKGLKQYTPEVGWESLDAQDSYAANAIAPARASSLGVQTSGPHAHQDFQAPQRHLQAQRLNSDPGTTPAASQRNPAPHSSEDPLIKELFDQLRQPVEDQLSKSWKTIATNVNSLSQCMDQQRQLRAQLKALEEQGQSLRVQILSHLDEVQHTADRQLSVARLRVEVSSLARHKLSDKLKKV